MSRCFNITGSCNPKKHYMVDLSSRLAEIKKYVDDEKYFVINRGRQYGKTTTIKALANYLKPDYIVVSMDFQMQMSNAKFVSEESFSNAFAEGFLEKLEMSGQVTELASIKEKLGHVTDLVELFRKLSSVCHIIDRPIVLIIDEVDSASNNQVFLDFLAQLRGYYLNREEYPTFQSVILAGVHDIRNLKQKIRPDAEHKHNSPWNIASDFDVEMSFSVSDISGVLKEYENDHHTRMDISEISQLLYDYTSGYPVLVSWLCKLMDESGNVWNKEGVIEADKALLMKNGPLFESLINKLEDDESLRNLIYTILFKGENVMFNRRNAVIASAAMYGFVKNQNGAMVIANRIFETILYEWFISAEATNQPLSMSGMQDKNQFVTNGHLNMDLILEKFVLHFNDLYKDETETFKENDGRKLFLLYLRPIINDAGNYYIEAQTRDMRRTDVIVDYLGQQFVIEMKIWHGDEYNRRGEQQLLEYLDYYHIDKGYLLSFNFNRNKTTGVHTVDVGNKTIFEAVV